MTKYQVELRDGARPFTITAVGFYLEQGWIIFYDTKDFEKRIIALFPNDIIRSVLPLKNE